MTTSTTPRRRRRRARSLALPRALAPRPGAPARALRAPGARLRARAPAAPLQLAPAALGVGLIEWDEVALARGIVRMTKLLAITPRGHVVHLPGNARAAPVDLAEAGTSTVRLHLHLLVEPSYEREDERARDLEAVELAVRRIELTPSAGHPGALDSLELARFELGPDGAWAVSAAYVPPLLSLAAWPGFFSSVTARLRAVLAAWEDILLGDLESHVLSIAKGLRAHECLRRSRSLVWYLAQIESGGELSGPPFELYRRIVELYLDVHGYQARAADRPALAADIYDHRDLVGSFAPPPGRARDPHVDLPHGRAEAVCALHPRRPRPRPACSPRRPRPSSSTGCSVRRPSGMSPDGRSPAQAGRPQPPRARAPSRPARHRHAPPGKRPLPPRLRSGRRLLRDPHRGRGMGPRPPAGQHRDGRAVRNSRRLRSPSSPGPRPVRRPRARGRGQLHLRVDPRSPTR